MVDLLKRVRSTVNQTAVCINAERIKRPRSGALDALRDALRANDSEKWSADMLVGEDRLLPPGSVVKIHGSIPIDQEITKIIGNHDLDVMTWKPYASKPWMKK